MARSLSVVPKYIEIVKLARQRNFPRDIDLANDLALSRATVNNFLNGRPVDCLNFQELCRTLALDWREVAGLGSPALPDLQPPLDKTEANSKDIEQPGQAEQATASVDNGMLYSALLRLDFRDQVSLFRHFVEAHTVGSCLIHGEPEYGHRWLLNRLLQLVPNGRSAKVISVDLNRRSRASYLDSLWRELGGRAGLPPQLYPPQKIAEAVCKWWQTQTVILVFQNVDRMPQEYMKQFLCEFWLPLVEISGNCSPRSGSYRLLMLLVDYSGCVEQWKIDCVEALDSTWKPQILVKLPRLNRLSDRDLAIWMETGINDLPVKLTSQVERTVQSILENSENGLPELVLEYICSLCECNWYDWEQVWLKH